MFNKHWIDMDPVADGDVSSRDQWNDFLSNTVLLRGGNTAYSQAAGNESSVSFVTSPSLTSMFVPHLDVTLEWGGNPILLTYMLNWSEGADKSKFTFYLTNDFNSEEIELPVTGSENNRGYAACGGMLMLTYSSVPTEPRRTLFRVVCRATATSGVARSFVYSGKPGLLLWELPR